jgi:hypothetical protein
MNAHDSLSKAEKMIDNLQRALKYVAEALKII